MPTARNYFVWSVNGDSYNLERLDFSRGPNNILFGEPARPIDNAIALDTNEIYFYSPELLDGAAGFPGKRNLYVAEENGDIEHVTTFEPVKAISRINVTPNGRHLAFVSMEQLTSYDNNDFSEMYTYDRQRDEIFCVSCVPDGSIPTSHVEGSQNGLFMSDDGRVYFATRDALVPQDANGIRDVYEFVDNNAQLITSGGTTA